MKFHKLAGAMCQIPVVTHYHLSFQTHGLVFYRNILIGLSGQITNELGSGLTSCGLYEPGTLARLVYHTHGGICGLAFIHCEPKKTHKIFLSYLP